jgi:hypothetical protein
MNGRPILFSAPMVRALLDGTKTQTRRLVKPAPDLRAPIASVENIWGGFIDIAEKKFPCPYGQPGDRLWVRETFMDLTGTGVEHRDRKGLRQRYAFAVDSPPGSYGYNARKDFGLKWKPAIHMPRAASRILLEVVSVRVERLRGISRKDAAAEGLHCYEHFWRDSDYPLDDIAYEPAQGWPTRYSCPVQAYQALWESINGAGSWDANPWVWVVEFKRVTP